MLAAQPVVALVDGNVERVVSRVDGRELDPKKGPGKRAITERVEGITCAFCNSQ